MMEGPFNELRGLIEDYIFALELGQHQEVSDKGMTIQKRLIELLDEDILETDADSGRTNSLLSEKLKVICKKLTQQSKLAATYKDVVEFVRIKDMVCLGILVGAIPEKTSDFFDCDNLSRILRKSIYLLRLINLQDTKADETFLDRSNIIRLSGTGFPIFRLDDLCNVVQNERYQDLNDLDALLKIRGRQGPLYSILSSEWFMKFCSHTLNRPYPMERFTVLISVWIIGVECRHSPLEQFIGELVDQIYHEEANSCSEEEFMQLTQVGSFWLSYHKRYKTNFSQSNCTGNRFEEGEDENDDCSRASDGSDYNPSSSSPSNSSLESALDDNRSKDYLAIDTGRDSSIINFRSKLRKIINFELLYGSHCLVCEHKPSQPFDMIKLDSCLSCGNRYNIEYCSLSFKPLPLFSLTSLMKFRSKLNSLILLSPNEWVRYIIRAQLSSKPAIAEDEPTERVDISKTFEKLTIIRATESGRRKNSIDNDNNHDHDGMASIDGDSSYRKSLIKFAESVNSRRTTKDNDDRRLSESVQMINFSEPDISELALCSSDLLLFDDEPLDEHFLKARFIASNSFLEAGSLWQCVARSAVSRLPFGCGRLFGSLELIRSGKAEEDTLSRSFACPFCKLFQLSKVNSLYDDQDSLKT